MNYTILLLAGQGTRLGHAKNKVFLNIGHKFVCEYAIETLVMHQNIHHIILVHSPKNTLEVTKIIKRYGTLKPMSAVLGGEKRQDSVRLGLVKIRQLSKDIHKDNVLVHNGCNPFVHHDEITQLLHAIDDGNNAAVLAQPAKDTLRKVLNNRAIETLPREIIWHMQTPQAMPLAIAMQAYENTINKPFYATDDVELVMRLGYDIAIIPCSDKNFKITSQYDLNTARAIVLQSISLIGIGEDSHRYNKEKTGLWLGGIFILDAWSTIANSDGDVILHALYNAISSAIGEGSIGESFPETTIDIKNKSSIIFIEHVKKKLLKLELQVKQISISITAKQPMIAPLANKIKKRISKLFMLEEKYVGITATSGEAMSYEQQSKWIRSVVMVALGPVEKR